MTHLLKSWPGEFIAVRDGRKVHEIRRADRDFKVGDSLIFQEFIPNGTSDPATRQSLGKFTGRHVLRRITYVTPPSSWGLPADVCVLSLGIHHGALPAAESAICNRQSEIAECISSPS